MADETTRRSAVAEYAEAQDEGPKVVAEARAGRGGRADVVKGTLSYLALLALWELVMPRLYPELSLPRFVPAALAYYGTAEFWASLAVSFRRVAVGYLTAAALAIPLGIFLGYVPRLHRFFDPLLALIRPISPLAWLPLALVWFGISEGAAIFLIAYTAFFPIFLNTLHGVLEAPLQFKEAALTLGARKDQIAVHVTLPGAFTSVLTGVGYRRVVGSDRGRGTGHRVRAAVRGGVPAPLLHFPLVRPDTAGDHHRGHRCHRVRAGQPPASASRPNHAVACRPEDGGVKARWRRRAG